MFPHRESFSEIPLDRRGPTTIYMPKLQEGIEILDPKEKCTRNLALSLGIPPSQAVISQSDFE
jgi:hypothetical protein